MALIRPVDDTIVVFFLVDACDTVFSKDEQQLVCTSAYDEAFGKSSNIPLGILILFNPGLRVGELCALKWQGIETSYKGTYIHVQREVVNNITDD